jgi:hypothetical protein
MIKLKVRLNIHVMLGVTIVRISSFILHFLSALFMTFVAIQCNNIFMSNIYKESFTDSNGWSVIIPEDNCAYTSDDKQCFFKNIRSYDVKQEGMTLNILALIAAFEWISASFALYYLKESISWTPFISFIWNSSGVIVFMPFVMDLTILQAGLTAISLIAATMSQANDIFRETFHDLTSSHGKDQIFPPPSKRKNYHSTSVRDFRGYNIVVSPELLVNGQSQPKQKLTQTQTILHYSEYCTSASLLFLAVLILYMPDPLSWIVITCFVSILLCNLSGIAAHYSKLDQHNALDTPWYDLDWSKPGNHFKLLMLHSWSSLILALTILIYNSWYTLSSTDVPFFVRFTLYNLLVTFSAFGIFASICYIFSGTKRQDFSIFDKWMIRLDIGLTILSIASKLPIAYAVFYGVINMPGNNNKCNFF